MALGATGISTAVVNTELGSPYTTPRIIKDLCTYANVNPCSFGRPGMWDVDATADKFIYYQVARGIGYTDPRGTYNGTDKEVYHLGDFRYYNHSAITPYCNFPAGTTEYGYGTTTATGLSRTVYVGEMDWKQTLPEHYSENDWATMTNVHLLDASDDSIAGTAAIPTSGGNANISITPFSISTPGLPVTKTYHVAFGVDTTHWSFKMGTDQGLGGIGTITAVQLKAALLLDIDFDASTPITGGSNDPYTSIDWSGSGAINHRTSGASVGIWTYTGSDGFRCYHSGGYDDYKNINADCYLKGFKSSPSTEYSAGNRNIATDNADNSFTLSLGGSPGTWSDGDEVQLILKNITINY
jgi:hypothetical protein